MADYKKYMSREDEEELAAAGKAWTAADKAGDQAGRDAAHQWAESIRAKHGYSGGADGTQFNPLGGGGWLGVGSGKSSSQPKATGDTALTGGDPASQIQAAINALQSSQPYSGSRWDRQADRLTDKALGYSYSDFLGGEDYAALAKRYNQQGQRSMDDVLGQVSARTGGLASSYATQVAAQERNDWMSQLEDVARSLYTSQRNEMLENANYAQGMGDRAYQRYLNAASSQQQGASTAIDALYQLMGYQDSQNQTARSEAQQRVYDYLVNQGGAVGSLDADLITKSGYTTAELTAMEAQARRAAQQAATKQSSSSGSGSTGGSGGESKPRLTAAQTLSALEDGVVNDSTLADYEYWFGQAYQQGGEKPETQAAAPAKNYGSSYSSIWSRARTMHDQGKTDAQVLEFLDQFNESQLTDDGLKYIMRSLNLNGYRSNGG